MNVTYDNENRILKLQMTEEIDHCMAEKIRSKADFEIQKYLPQEVLMDFENVSFMDSAGIGLILGRYKQAEMYGGKLELINVSEKLKRIFEMSGILRIIKITDKENIKKIS